MMDPVSNEIPGSTYPIKTLREMCQLLMARGYMLAARNREIHDPAWNDMLELSENSLTMFMRHYKQPVDVTSEPHP